MEPNFKVNMNEYLPLRDVVFNTLRQAILRGELKPGERLMEIQLANKLGVSRTPIREAIRKLELEGLVLMIPRKGAEVAEITEKNMRDVLEVRKALEELAVQLACEKITDEEIEEMKKAAEEFKMILKSKDTILPVFFLLKFSVVGVAVDAMFTGLSSALNSMNGGNMSGVAAIVNGNITMKTWDDVKTLVPYVIVGLILALIMTKMCNLLALEDKTARSLGINVNAMRIVISLIAVLLASISTAVAGVISFLGLIVPHIGRILVGSDHKALVPFSALFGAFTFLLADTIGRTIAAPNEVSASIIMSVVGGPFFIILLRRSKKYAK